MGGDSAGVDDAYALTDEAALAVIAHGLLNSLTVVKGSVEVLRDSCPDLAAEQLRRWLDRIDTQAGLMATILYDLVRGYPREAIVDLEGLGAEAVPSAGRQ